MSDLEEMTPEEKPVYLVIDPQATDYFALPLADVANDPRGTYVYRNLLTAPNMSEKQSGVGTRAI